MPKSPDEKPHDPRLASRGRTFLAAKVAWDGGVFSFDCVMRDLSSTGARLKLPPSCALPNTFHLLEVKSGEIWEAQIAWRRYPEIGVTFLRTCDKNSDDPNARLLKRLRAESLERTGLVD